MKEWKKDPDRRGRQTREELSGNDGNEGTGPDCFLNLERRTD